MQAFFGTAQEHAQYMEERGLTKKDVVLVLGPMTVMGYAERIEPIFGRSVTLNGLGNSRSHAYEYVQGTNHKLYPEETNA